MKYTFFVAAVCMLLNGSVFAQSHVHMLSAPRQSSFVTKPSLRPGTVDTVSPRDSFMLVSPIDSTIDSLLTPSDSIVLRWTRPAGSLNIFRPYHFLLGFPPNGAILGAIQGTLADSQIVFHYYDMINWTRDTVGLSQPFPWNVTAYDTNGPIAPENYGHGIFYIYFVKPLFIIVSSAGSNGKILPMDTEYVRFDGNRTYSITPDNGYVIDSIIVDGVPQAINSSYGFTRVMSSHTICATFKIPSVSLTFSYSANWNLISVPFTGALGLRSLIFPTSFSTPFYYANGYEVADTLVPGTGYWLRIPVDERRIGTVLPLVRDTIALNAGWNIIGSIGYPVAMSNIISNTPGLILSEMWGYAGGYVQADTIEPGMAYWVKANESGTIILMPASTASPRNRANIVPTGELPPAPPIGEIAKKEIPKQFSLAQNFPNPFNPTTIISYGLPKAGYTTLRVYDLLGKEVALLVKGMETAGMKRISFDASTLPSGVYLYKLQSGDFTDVKKMLVIK